MKNIHKPTAILAIFAFISPVFIPSLAEQITHDGWALEYRPAPGGESNEIIITKARGEGYLDLSSVNDFKITGALPSAFAYNSALTSIKLPAAFTTLSEQLQQEMEIKGQGEPYSSSSGVVSPESTGIINLDYNLNEQPVRIRLNVTSNGAAANQYGCCLLASGTKPFEQGSYTGGFQLFLETGANGTQTITIKDGSSTAGQKFTHPAGQSFQMELYYNPIYNFLMAAVRYEDGTVDTASSKPSEFSVDTLCYGLPEGVDETLSISDACMPFAGCDALQSIEVADGNSTFINGTNGELLDSDGQTIAAFPYGQLFGKVIRVGSVSESSTCFSVDAYESEGGYQDRSVDFRSPDTSFGTTLFRLEANSDGTCSFRHLNTGFLLGRKADNTSMTLDAVQDPVYSGKYDYTLLPGSPLEARFVFTDPYTGPTSSLDGVWCITDDDGHAVMKKNVSIADADCCFTISEIKSVDVPVNSEGLASVCLPVDITVPDIPVQTMIITGYNPDTNAVTTGTITSGSIIKAGTGILLKNAGAGSVSLAISEESAGGIATTGNLLSSTNLRIPSHEGTTYLLSGKIFLAHKSADIPANTAYLNPSSLPSSASGKSFLTLSSEIYTGIEMTGSGSICQGEAFDLSGLRVDPATAKGIIIINGKKEIRH